MSISPTHWIFVAVLSAMWIIPLYRILGRIGWSRLWALVVLFPPFIIVLLWVMAFKPWPSRTDRPQ